MLNKHLALLQDAGPGFYIRRSGHMLQKRLGILKRRNAFKPTSVFPVSLQEWREHPRPFVFDANGITAIPKNPNPILQQKWDVLQIGQFTYFHGQTLPLASSDSWHTHPLDGYRYDQDTHWTEIPDLAEGRDIKWIWERARFCHLCTVIRHDHHFGQDHSAWAINEMLDWIEHNPLHKGPHYVSAQEVALRILNWLFAIHYYSQSTALTEQKWQRIMCSIADQTRHIHVNIAFSQKLVRNNHLLTEAAALFVFGCLFPEADPKSHLKEKGWKILRSEALYQFAPDGTYLQYSLNYHRVALQVYTYAIAVAVKHQITIPVHMQERLHKALDFLAACSDSDSGLAPNYGHNDGSLFFPLNDHAYADLRPSIQALGQLLGRSYFAADLFEDTLWMAGTPSDEAVRKEKRNYLRSFTDGGYYLYRDGGHLTFIRCGEQRHRPAQADQLHLDIHLHGEPLVIDAGTYTYNGDPKDITYCFGTAGHNTIMLENNDQMLKGPRFIWFYWTRCMHADWKELDDKIVFNGNIRAFRQTGSSVIHHRKVVIQKQPLAWSIEDTIKRPGNSVIHQLWHVTDAFFDRCTITAVDENGRTLTPVLSDTYYAPTYGVKKHCRQITFSTAGKTITTHITQR